MTWRERRTITILTTILLVLTAMLLIVLGIRYREHRAEAEAGPGLLAADGVPALDPNTYTALTYYNGAATLSFTRDEEGVWRWDANGDFPLDPATVTGILDLLSAWRPQQVLTDQESLEASGMEDSTASLTAAAAGGGVTTLLFGKATTDGLSDYVRLNGDESTVYIIDGALRRMMDIPIYDMCVLPELPVLAEANFRSVSIQGPVPEESETVPITILTAQHSGGTTSWHCNGTDVSGNATLRALLEDLTALRLSKCVDFLPSDEAAEICGFGDPQAVVRIAYTLDSGEGALLLTVGSRLPDRSGRYARVGEDAAIYLVETDLLDPLMRVAAQGLT